MKLSLILSLFLPTLLSIAAAQLSGPVGPTTSRASKRTKVCNVLDYGAVANRTADVGPALSKAFADCRNGGTVYIPPGDYGMSTRVSLTGGKSWALQLDGVIYRVGTAGGTMIFIGSTTDFELYSSTSKGAMQGFGYTFHTDGNYGPRLLRLGKVTNFSIHDIALVDSPAFHLVLDTCTNGEVYNMIIRGGNEGGLDGIDVWGSNVHVHDVEVTNRDECVTVKSPASNMLIENIYCNWSGGSAMGSLGSNTSISQIHYRNLYTINSNQMYMLKSRGGSGSVTNCTFESFIGHSNAYSLDLNADWSSQKVALGDGVLYQDITFRDWKGTCSDGLKRGPVNIICPDKVPCRGILVEGFEVWTEAGDNVVWKCANAYGSGVCLKSGSGTGYAVVTSTISTAPSGYASPRMPNELTAGFALTASIPIPPVPTTFFPGATPASKLLGA